MTHENPARTIRFSMDACRLCIALAGAALVGYGAWLWFPPAGFVVLGTLLLVASLVGALRAE